MKKLFTFTLVSVALIFSGCEKAVSWMQNTFDSERDPQEKKLDHPRPTSHPRRGVESMRYHYLYFLRGNNASLLEAKNFPGKYVLTFHGIGRNLIYIKDATKSETSGFFSIQDFLSHWKSQESVNATLIIMRNESTGTQKDAAIDIDLTTPRYDIKSSELSFLIESKTVLSKDYLNTDLGSCALLLQHP